MDHADSSQNPPNFQRRLLALSPNGKLRFSTDGVYWSTLRESTQPDTLSEETTPANSQPTP